MDGSKKIGELHVNRSNYRNFEANDTNLLKKVFARIWMGSLVGKLKKLDRLVVLTEKNKDAWPELSNVVVIPDPLPIQPKTSADVHTKSAIIAIWSPSSVRRFKSAATFICMAVNHSKIMAIQGSCPYQSSGSPSQVPTGA